jgi:hypothetical protein
MESDERLLCVQEGSWFPFTSAAGLHGGMAQSTEPLSPAPVFAPLPFKLNKRRFCLKPKCKREWEGMGILQKLL